MDLKKIILFWDKKLNFFVIENEILGLDNEKFGTENYIF